MLTGAIPVRQSMSGIRSGHEWRCSVLSEINRSSPLSSQCDRTTRWTATSAAPPEFSAPAPLCARAAGRDGWFRASFPARVLGSDDERGEPDVDVLDDTVGVRVGSRAWLLVRQLRRARLGERPVAVTCVQVGASATRHTNAPWREQRRRTVSSSTRLRTTGTRTTGKGTSGDRSQTKRRSAP